jgi:hypothetical protein
MPGPASTKGAFRMSYGLQIEARRLLYWVPFALFDRGAGLLASQADARLESRIASGVIGVRRHPQGWWASGERTRHVNSSPPLRHHPAASPQTLRLARFGVSGTAHRMRLAHPVGDGKRCPTGRMRRHRGPTTGNAWLVPRLWISSKSWSPLCLGEPQHL